MSYREFTWSKVKETFKLTAIEGNRFLPEIAPIAPSDWLQETLRRGIPWAMAVGGEKARSEAIIAPFLLELREILAPHISIFSGEEFNVEAETGLTGYCDFLVSRSPEQIAVEAPVLVVIEAKKAEIKAGLGQIATQGSEETSEQSVANCAAEMVAAQKFNQFKGNDVKTIYGCVTTGTAWRFLKLEGSEIWIDFTDYSLPPIDNILGILAWMSQQQ